MPDAEEAKDGLTVALVGRARAYQALGNAGWRQDLSEACTYSMDVASECSPRAEE